MPDTHPFKPSDLEKLVGIPTEVQRDRRRRNPKPYFGKRNPSGRWTFSKQDLLGLAVADIAFQQLNDVFESERFGYWSSYQVGRHLNLLAFPEFFAPLPRDVMVDGPNDKQTKFNFMIFEKGHNPLFTNDASRIGKLGVPTALVGYLPSIARAIKPELVDVLTT